MQQVLTLIIGAGPAGLATGACLRQLGVPFLILEASDRVAASWHQHYERLHLHTDKELIRYFEAYAQKYELPIRFNTRVQHVEKIASNAYRIRTEEGTVYKARHLILATGVNRIAHRPELPGEDGFRGHVMHSQSYREPSAYNGQRVLVVGMGNTGAEIALDLSSVAAETYISVRSPVSVVPRDFLGNSTQVTALRLARLPTALADWIGKQMAHFTMGDLRKYGVPLSREAPARRLRQTGKTPVIDVGTAQQIRKGRIQVVGPIDKLCNEGVVLRDGKMLTIDTIVLGTGYRAAIPGFFPQAGVLLDDRGYPRQVICDEPWQGLYFIGFDNYTPGGILGVIRRDAPLIAAAVQQQL